MKKQEQPSSEPTLYHLIIFHGNDGSIDRGLLQTIQEQLEVVIQTSPEETEIDVWIESPGGDAHSAYKLVLDLRQRCRQLRAVVPDYAKSAATLLALGMDVIFMGAAAELGPLDVQIPHPDPDREGIIVSALDVANALEFLGKTAVSLVLTGGASIVEITGLRRSEVLRETLQFTAQFLEPITAKLDPHLLHKAFNELRIAERYAINMLGKRNLPAISEERAKELMRHLIRAYPAHGFVISRDEARNLDLPVQDLRLYPRRNNVKTLYNNFVRQPDPITSVILDSDLDGTSTQTGVFQETNHDTNSRKGDAEIEPEAVPQSAKQVSPDGLKAHLRSRVGRGA